MGNETARKALSPRYVGDTTITGKNQVSIPARGMRALGWEKGDQLLVEVVHEDLLVLMRRPGSWADAFAGRLSDVFGGRDEILEYLDAERRSWGEG